MNCQSKEKQLSDREGKQQPAKTTYWKTPTLGGRQFWTDQCWRDGWRIQKHAATGQCRLIDPNNLRHVTGTMQHCEEALVELVPKTRLAFDRAVVLIHGLLRTSASMKPVGKALKKQIACETVYFEYASTRASIEEHGQALRLVLESLPPDVELSIVAHSLGSILTRYILGMWEREGCQRMLQRIDSVVMLGPPNQGAELASKLSRLGIFGMLTGESGMQLGPRWQSIEDRLAIPTCPFGIIAGRMSNGLLKNPLLGPNSDFVVSVEETKLEGATDFMEVDKMHTLLMNDPRVQDAVIHFLLNHRFSNGTDAEIPK